MNWLKWTFLEALTKVFSSFIKKRFIGLFLSSFIGVFAVIFTTGIVQMFAGIIGSTKRNKTLLISRRKVVFIIFFGTTAFLMKTLDILAFSYYGADFDSAVFIMSLSIIPGAIIDRVFFNNRIVPRQFLGIGIFLFAGYAMFNFPSLEEIKELPIWVFLLLSNAVLAAINEGFSRSAAKVDVDPFVKNFWVGITTVFLALFSLISLDFAGFDSFRVVFAMPFMLWIAALANGLCSVGIVSFKLLSYKDGAYIVLKKITMNGARLAIASLAAFVLLNEQFSLGNAIGIVAFFIAFGLVDNKTWKFLKEKFQA